MTNVRALAIGLTLTSGLALASSSANAADIYRREAAGGYKDPVYVANTWTGFYVGANIGYGESDSNNRYTDGTNDTVIFRGADQSGVFGGGQIGYNFQAGRFVYGVEADIQASDIDDRYNAYSFNNGTDIGRANSRLDYFGTVRGRLGYAFDNTLIYATGGFAYGGIKSTVDDSISTPRRILSKDETLTGYAVGGGIEQKISPNWSIKGEYQYIDLGSYNLDGTTGRFVGARSSDIDATYHTVRFGVNYHFNKEYESLK